jgi:chorismate mutase
MAEEKGNGKAGGCFDRIKKHKVTLTRAGESLAPLRKRKSEKPAKKAKKGKGKPKAKAAGKKKPISLPSRRERQVNELKTLANIGKRDPERLAAIITRMLMDEDEQSERERLKFERMVWKRAEKHDKPPEEGGDDGPGRGPACDDRLRRFLRHI